MNVTSLELSRELYELSGWKDTEHTHEDKLLSKDTKGTQDDPHIMGVISAYDLGCLLRKLPRPTYIYGVHDLGGDIWTAKATHMPRIDTQRADTPENAVAKLAIELFKQNILTKEEL